MLGGIAVRQHINACISIPVITLFWLSAEFSCPGFLVRSTERGSRDSPEAFSTSAADPDAAFILTMGKIRVVDCQTQCLAVWPVPGALRPHKFTLMSYFSPAAQLVVCRC